MNHSDLPTSSGLQSQNMMRNHSRPPYEDDDDELYNSTPLRTSNMSYNNAQSISAANAYKDRALYFRKKYYEAQAEAEQWKVKYQDHLKNINKEEISNYPTTGRK